MGGTHDVNAVLAEGHETKVIASTNNGYVSSSSERNIATRSAPGITERHVPNLSNFDIEETQF